MFGIGGGELVLILIVALIVVGPKNLPTALRAIGKAIGELRRASSTLREEVGFDQVVDEVARPLREGIAGIEADVNKIQADVRSMDPAKALNPPIKSSEYPIGGPDDYGALSENATVYPETAPVYATTEAGALEGTVPRSTADETN